MRENVAALVVALAAVLPYAGALGHGFVWDDVANIVNNPWLRDVSGIGSAFTGQAAGFDPRFSTSYYRPVMHTLNLATYSIAGPAAAAFHAVNLLLHVLASVLTFRTTRAILARFGEVGDRTAPAALAAGLVFAVHPVHVEAVAWLAGINDLALAVFGLACVLGYLTARTTVGFVLAGVWMFLALLSKEPAATLPGVLLAFEFLPRGRPDPGIVRRMMPVGVAVAAYAALRWNALGGFAPVDNRAGVGIGTSILAGFELLASYLRYLVVPFPLSALHPFDPPSSLLDLRAVSSIAACAAFVGAFAGARRWPTVRLALLWIVLPLLPVLWIPALGEGVFAERYLYFPSAGLAILVGWAGVRVLESNRKSLLGAAAGAMTLVLALAGWATWQRSAVWRDSVSLWTDTVRQTPESAAAQEYLCAALYEAGRFQEAGERCREALRLDGTRVDARINLGNTLAVLGDLDGALASLDDALRLRPNSVGAWTTRGLVRMAQGASDDALRCYARALEIDPNNAEARNVLGVAYARLGRPDEARRELARAVQLAPDREEYRRNLESLGGPP
jgi:tetratricopeptide (TPR) repeat protein